jgi:hypothetical protein
MIIDVNNENTQFVITCPFYANELIRDLPNRRWSKAKRAWTSPIIRANVEHIRTLTTMGGVTTTPAAVDALARYDQDRANAGFRGAGFPYWYKFKREPRTHQMEALKKGYGLHAYALFMDMQTGKSKTSIDMVTAHRMEGHIQAVLILTKLTLRKNWAGALEDDCPIPYSVHLPRTDNKVAFEKWLSTPHDFKIMIAGWESLSVGGMAKMCERFLLSHHPTAIIGDETNYIMTHKATRSKEAERLSKMAEYRYALTGTPATEGPMKLYQQFEFLDTNIIGIGDFYAFRNRYAVMGGYVPKEGPMKGKPLEVVGYQNMDELMELIAPHSFQVMKTDAYDLPPKRYQLREIELTEEQRKVYSTVKKEGVIRHGDEETTVKTVLEVMLRLHQICGGYTVIPRKIQSWDKDGNPKIKMTYDPMEILPPAKNPKIIELKSIVEEARHKQGIIWAVYLPEVHAIIKVLRSMGLKVGELHGGIPEDDRQPMVDAFRAGDIQWVVGNASTGGMGYTMMASEINIFYNNTFKMRDRLQAEDRAWGDGQTKSGIWIDLVAAKSVDVTIKAALKDKEDLHNFIRHRLRDITAMLDGMV